MPKVASIIFSSLIPFVLIWSVHASYRVAEVAEFAPGQMWSIKSDLPTTAKVIIGRIETWKGEIVVHCSIIDIPLPQPNSLDNVLTQIDHIPFERSALALSVDKLVSAEVHLPAGFERGYDHWRSDQRANIFTISASKAISLLLETVIRTRT